MSSVFLMYRALYTGSMPTQMPPHAYAEWKGCLRRSFPILGAYAGASTDSAYATKSTLVSRVPTHTYSECKISGQRPTQLHKEFPQIHNIGHSKKTMLRQH